MKKIFKEKSSITALAKFREKRRWQIALRRYVLDRTKATPYAPYFGLDIENLREWFEMQFTPGIEWSDYAKSWQFDHIIPVTYFDFADDQELRLCWNFTNLRVENFTRNKDRGHRLDVLAAKGYFEELYQTTKYLPCKLLLEKIDRIELSALISTEKQQEFIRSHREYLTMIEDYSEFEFELINRGRSPESVKQEVAFLKKFGSQS